MKPLDEAFLLLKKAAEDEVVLDKLLADPDLSDSIWGFHAQQAVEKMIKAVLMKKSVTYPKTHDLSLLYGIVNAQNISMPFNEDDLNVLEPFAVDLRYEANEAFTLDRIEVRATVKLIRTWAEAQVKNKDSSSGK